MKKKIDASELFEALQTINWCGNSDLYEQVANVIWTLQEKPRFSVCVIDIDNGQVVTPAHIIGASSETEARRIYATIVPQFYADKYGHGRWCYKTEDYLGRGAWNFGYRIVAKRI